MDQRADQLEKIITNYENNTSMLSKILLGNQIMASNLGYASSVLSLRP